MSWPDMVAVSEGVRCTSVGASTFASIRCAFNAFSGSAASVSQNFLMSVGSANS